MRDGPMTPEDLPDTATCYVPGFGETTVGEIRRTAGALAEGDSDQETIRMWCYIVTHPNAKPWKDGSRPWAR